MPSCYLFEVQDSQSGQAYIFEGRRLHKVFVSYQDELRVKAGLGLNEVKDQKDVP